jgi:ParB family chromosome partitioning protein
MADVGIEQLHLSPARPPGFIPRPTPALRRRIAKHGVLEPVVVRRVGREGYEILSNPASWIAAGQAGLHTVPVFIREGLSDAEAAAIVLDHYQSAALNAIDEAQGFDDQLQELGGHGQYGAIARLAVRVGRSRTYVAHALRLLALPESIQDLVRSGKLSPGQARPLVTVRGAALQTMLARKILAEGLSARAAEALALEHRHPGSTAAAPARGVIDPNVQRLEQAVTELIGSPFAIRGNEAVFNFFGNYEVLEGLLRRLGYRAE